MRYDVIVVGAGPAGSTTARECASRGLSVLMLDKAEFPRDKPCGGAITPRAARLLPFDIDPVVERTVSGIQLTTRHSKEVTRYFDKNLAYLTQRRNLDSFLVEHALEAGVTLRERAPIREVDKHPSHVVVRTNDETFEGSTLVAADGANGQTAKMSGIDAGIIHGIALEGNVKPSNGFPNEWEDKIGLDFGSYPGGYGWIFPKGDHLNIGLGGWKHIGPSLRSRLDGLTRFYGYDPEDLWGLRGHHLPIRQLDSSLAVDNVLLVGDAGGLLDPMTGEGIYAAIWSGRTAARHLAEYVGGEVDDLDGYQQDVENDLMPDLRASRQFHDLFHLSPGLYMWAERHSSFVWDLTCRIVLGEQTYVDIMKRHPKLATAIDFVSDLVRVTPFLQRIAGMREPAPPQRFFRRNTKHR